MSTDPGGENCHRSSYWKTLQRPRVATSQERRTKPDRKSSETVTSEVTSVVGPLKTSPKRKTKASPLWWAGTLYKTGRGIDPAQERELPQERTDLSPWKQKLSFVKLGKYRWTSKWKTRKHIQNTLKNKVTLQIKHRNAQGSTKPLWRTYCTESNDSDTDCVVASLNLEEVLNNYNTWNY